MQPTSNLIVVKCPDCGIKLSFKPVPNYLLKPITCPKCHKKGIVKDFNIIDNPKDGQTIIIPKAYITCIETGEKYQLNDGHNTVGRKAAAKKADITFTDKDMYMSRLHASIDCHTVKGRTCFQLRDENSANGTFVNGIRVPEKSIVKLNPNDKFNMGRLTFVCTVPQSDNAVDDTDYTHDKDYTTL